MPSLQVWYKHDLRTDDHPGLTAAATGGGPIVPFYCFDARYCAQLLRTPRGIEGASHMHVSYEVIGEPIKRLAEFVEEPIKLTGKRALRTDSG